MAAQDIAAENIAADTFERRWGKLPEGRRLDRALLDARRLVERYTPVPLSLSGHEPFHRNTPVEQLVRRVAYELYMDRQEGAERLADRLARDSSPTPPAGLRGGMWGTYGYQPSRAFTPQPARSARSAIDGWFTQARAALQATRAENSNWTLWTPAGISGATPPSSHDIFAAENPWLGLRGQYAYGPTSHDHPRVHWFSDQRGQWNSYGPHWVWYTDRGEVLAVSDFRRGSLPETRTARPEPPVRPATTAAHPILASGPLVEGMQWRQDHNTLYWFTGRTPQEVFANGAVPRGDQAAALLDYVYHQREDTSWVSTTRNVNYLTDASVANPGGASAMYRRYTWRYTIRVPGGVDVNATLDFASPYPYEKEIAFPGGIHRRFIHSAVPVTPKGGNGPLASRNTSSRPILNPAFELYDAAPGRLLPSGIQGTPGGTAYVRPPLRTMFTTGLLEPARPWAQPARPRTASFSASPSSPMSNPPGFRLNAASGSAAGTTQNRPSSRWPRPFQGGLPGGALTALPHGHGPSSPGEGALAAYGQALQDLARAQQTFDLVDQHRRTGQGPSADRAQGEAQARLDQARRDAAEARGHLTPADLEALGRAGAEPHRTSGLPGGTPWSSWLPALNERSHADPPAPLHAPLLPIPATDNPYLSLEREVFPNVRHFQNTDEAMRYGENYWSEHVADLDERSRSALDHYSREPDRSMPQLPYRVTFQEIKALNRDRSAGADPPVQLIRRIREINGAYLAGEHFDIEMPNGARQSVPERKYLPMAIDQVQRDTDAIDAALRTRSTPEDLVVTKGVDADFFGMPPEMCLGRVFREHPFMSTSLGPPVVNKPVILHLLVPRGTPALFIAYVSRFPLERELLIHSGREWQAVDVLAYKGRVHVFGRILPQSPPAHGQWLARGGSSRWRHSPFTPTDSTMS